MATLMIWSKLVNAVRSHVTGFVREERAATALVFALVLVPVMGFTVLAVDGGRMFLARARLDNAVDVAALTAASVYAQNRYESESSRRALAQDAADRLFQANLDSSLFSGNFTLSYSFTAEGEVTVTASGRFDTMLPGISGVTETAIGSEAAAQAGLNQRLEVIFALDNTGSMYSQNRLNLMRSAARNVVNDMFDAYNDPSRLRIGVLPWAALVNIRVEPPEEPSNEAASNRNLGFAGTMQPPANEMTGRFQYALNPSTGQPVQSEDELDPLFSPVEWRGCVNSAAGEVGITTNGTVFDPISDVPPSPMRWPAAGEPYDLSIHPNSAWMPRCNQSAGQRLNPNRYVPNDTSCTNNGWRVQGTLRSCVSDAFEFAYNDAGGRLCPWNSSTAEVDTREDTFMSGPNVACPEPQLALSSNRAQVIDAIDRMHPVTGGTLNDIALMWSLRMLSPRSQWTSFYGTDDNPPSDWDDPDVTKIVILLTDGENVSLGGVNTYYGYSGQPYPPNLGRFDLNTANRLMMANCEVLRSEPYNIELYTIAIDITNSTHIRNLETCAGHPARAFNIRSEDLDLAFQEIFRRTTRLTQ